MKINPIDITITDADIRWAEDLLQLPLKALDGERANAIKTMQSTDIQSCPGSGKTTLLIAKLAILSKKIHSKSQGICVLSHTNVARNEIEKKLGKYKEGQTLIHYPNFIGTIHNFIYEFIAIPWLRSKGITLNIIETNTALEYRYQQLPPTIKNLRALERTPEIDYLEIAKAPNTLKQIRWGQGHLKSSSQTYKSIMKVIEKSFNKGIFTYDELFLFTEEAVDNCAFMLDSIRHRFPIIFIDEAQDNSETQNLLLQKIFPMSDSEICRQRLGDGNQAIFNSNTAQEVVTDEFPNSTHISIGTSKRLSCEIARLSDPLGLVPYSMQGVSECEPENQHTIFIYNDDSIHAVLPAFGDLLLECENADGLPNYAVGMVHNLDRDEPIGANIQHYWKDYSPEHSKADPYLDNFIDYIHYAKGQITSAKPLDKAVDIVSKGIIKYINEYLDTALSTNQNKSYRRLINFINDFDNPIMLKEWIKNILQINNINNKLWEDDLIPALLTTLNDINIGIEFQFDDYLEWKEVYFDNNTIAETNNIYTHVKDGESVNINLGSIHSVKGQTHFATLVLDTFYRGTNGKTNLSHIIDWITGKKSGKGKSNITDSNRLKCHYVGMTRPTSLLCLAINKQQLTNTNIQELKAHGWNIQYI